ncbi:MAG: Phenylalanine-tRNA ligase alpha subunit [Parcubacteria group bacterium GW2011_GWB1_52_7]|nr:MAG: Phenylalanine-tRNA ligase alpha subunit [Parcubacteria group bacterium GW2011_GWA1_51_12]KKW28503.1 MAG: Phenylalanine-tRNA ligase alpha subunit [Parcubacteria group bacterium GW2011_GWB1_52_7]KKW30319.1 MAG: Phenylalanine-tRNA ligase alpha subunit [Parcubacteria group bacterium GW2011_GWC2_52_8c]
MTNVRNEFERIKKSALETLESAKTAEDVEMLRLKYLGRKGALNLILRGLKNLPDAERRTLGAEANAFRAALESKIGEALENSKADEKHPRFSKERLDVTRPGIPLPRGHLHPITRVLREVEDIFLRMGFTVAEGPEIETEHYNFDALNIPAEHPARDMWDTFWLRQNEIKIQSAGRRTKLKNNERLLLRTHTSPVQIRYMETHEPPIRIISPGIVYRYEATDASHDIEFWQIEGLMVDKDVSAANFKAVIERFFSELFRRVVSIRLRPSYFPFVEPGFEVDISCAQCKGKGCSICGQSGWLEMMGAGMVHPNVFKAVGYNPSPLAGGVQGFAFGMGLDRIAMMKYKIPDIRLMRSGDLRFLDQF